MPLWVMSDKQYHIQEHQVTSIVGKSALDMLGRICTIRKLSFNEPEHNQYFFFFRCY